MIFPAIFLVLRNLSSFPDIGWKGWVIVTDPNSSLRRSAVRNGFANAGVVIRNKFEETSMGVPQGSLC
ncbi:MAG: hypothetical protein OQK63_08580 [Ignavibacteriaceae bacterium]|nr:hypothetical protein [Ignavibacteriaceae bacterium]